ncbi:MAG: c-type cytochrome biogenesis protein CcmI [Betaproteobacteria bacterium]
MPSAPAFWLVALLMLAATVAALVWPLLRRRGAVRVEAEDAATTDVYRDQKRQLDADWAAGAITREERDRGLDELSSRLGAELARQPRAPAESASTRSSLIAALVVAAALPVTALALYAAFGAPDALRKTSSTDAGAPKSHDEIVAMVENLAARMKERPEDPTGWRLLARAYAAMGRFDESVAAFAQAATRGTEDASLLADWADALAMKQQSLQGEPARLIARALTLDPNHPKALSLAASAAFYRKDFDQAIAEWRKLQAQYAPGSDEAREVGAMIAEAETAKRGGSAASAGPPNAAANAAPAVAASGPPNIAANAATNADNTAEASAITGSVSLDAKLRDRATAGDTLFIYARAPTGSRMPVAITRTTAGAWPREFRLDDSMAMTPAARLSNAPEVIVEARISKSGNATPAAGDLVGSSGAIKPGARGVSIVIADVVR